MPAALNTHKPTSFSDFMHLTAWSVSFALSRFPDPPSLGLPFPTLVLTHMDATYASHLPLAKQPPHAATAPATTVRTPALKTHTPAPSATNGTPHTRTHDRLGLGPAALHTRFVRSIAAADSAGPSPLHLTLLSAKHYHTQGAHHTRRSPPLLPWVQQTQSPAATPPL